MYRPRSLFLFFAVPTLVFSVLPAAGESQARIVRLSDVQGVVQINKNSGLGFENAFLNLPVTQGTQLRTKERGRAEIEFEDGSTLRLTPNTTVDFNCLGLSESGSRVSEVNLVEGRAYVNWLGKSGDRFTLHFSQENVVLTQPAHFRVSAFTNKADIASFKNDLEVTEPSESVKVAKNKMLSFDVDGNPNAVPSVATRIQEDPNDEWDRQSISYHDEYSKNNSSPYGYGLSDLNYYGSYSNISGYGMLWQPYFTGANWDPFMDGAWSWYPGMGYMWASAYPWSWMPYYYGNWVFAPGYGWGWQPGGWNTWHGGVHYAGVAASGFHAPVAPTGTVSTVIVGKGGSGSSSTIPERSAIPERMVVRAGSAGLGIPRGLVPSLRHSNSEAARTGSAVLRTAPAFSTPSGGAGGYQTTAERALSAYEPAGHSLGSASGHSTAGTSGNGGGHR